VNACKARAGGGVSWWVDVVFDPDLVAGGDADNGRELGHPARSRRFAVGAVTQKLWPWPAMVLDSMGTH